jgi:NADH:ubiquinone oxidoreductase subunit 5 (subunit L)/multisubunit Na+/H+ antiporter MnhA subunit
MYIYILIFPLISFIISGVLGRYFGRLGSAYLSTLGLFLTLILGLFFFYEVAICKSIVSLKLYT